MFSPLNKSETRPGDKIKKKDSKSIEKKRGRPPTFPGVKLKITHGKDLMWNRVWHVQEAAEKPERARVIGNKIRKIWEGVFVRTHTTLQGLFP